MRSLKSFPLLQIYAHSMLAGNYVQHFLRSENISEKDRARFSQVPSVLTKKCMSPVNAEDALPLHTKDLIFQTCYVAESSLRPYLGLVPSLENLCRADMPTENLYFLVRRAGQWLLMSSAARVLRSTRISWERPRPLI